MTTTLLKLETMLAELNVTQRVSMKQSNDMAADLHDKIGLGGYPFAISENQWNAIANYALHLFNPSPDTDEASNLRARLLQLEADHEEGAGTILDLSEQLREQREQTASLLDLVARIRFALGDNGKRMQDELIDYCRGIDSLRQAAQAVVDRWDSPLWADLPHTGEFIAALLEQLTQPMAQTVTTHHRLTHEQISAEFEQKVGAYSESQDSARWEKAFVWFDQGVKAAERAHGIDLEAACMPPCLECGAETREKAETMCCCGGSEARKTMQATEKQVKMAAQLYDMRDKARRLLGEKYKSHMAELGKILKMTADRDNKSALAVAMEVCKKRELIGMDLMMVMAAAVELTEPTP